MTERARYYRGKSLADNELYVGRPTKWGNPFKVEKVKGGYMVRSGETFSDVVSKKQAHVIAVRLYKAYAKSKFTPADLAELRSKDYLSCWCPHDHACHVDALLELIDEQ